MGRLVINGEEVYELDEECLREKYNETKKKRSNQWESKEKQETAKQHH